MEYMREGIYLRSFAQKDPLTEYRAEGHAMFEELSAGIREEVVLTLFHAQIEPPEAAQLVAAGADGGPDGHLRYEHESLAGADAIAAAGGGMVAGPGAAVTAATPVGGGGGAVITTQPQQQIVRSEEQKLGRNDPCWCGSGKKYKKCHGA